LRLYKYEHITLVSMHVHHSLDPPVSMVLYSVTVAVLPLPKIVVAEVSVTVAPFPPRIVVVESSVIVATISGQKQ